MKIAVTAGDLRLLFLLHDDKTITEAAVLLGTDDGAVYQRLHRLRSKFGVRTTPAMMAKAAKLGVLDERHRPK